MNERNLVEMMKFANTLDEVSAKCGGRSAQAGMIRELVHEVRQLCKVIETLEGAHKIEVEKLENHYFNDVDFGTKLRDRKPEAKSRDDSSHHAG